MNILIEPDPEVTASITQERKNAIIWDTTANRFANILDFTSIITTDAASRSSKIVTGNIINVPP